MTALRRSGILLHPSSLPGRFSSGDLGPAAFRFLDLLARGGQSVWQVLPLGPVGPTGSPYDGTSAFAGNPQLISLEVLADDGLLESTELDQAAARAGDPNAQEVPLRAAWRRFEASATADQRAALAAFESSPEQVFWLDDWATFAALDRRYENRSWLEWPAPIAGLDLGTLADALAGARAELVDEIAYHRFVQFLFFDQWQRLRDQSKRLGILLYGDLPIYVAHHSADVFFGRELFELDQAGRSTAVGGVPPDAFSADGQRWGQPLYAWGRHREEGYRWWIRRIAHNLRLFDLLRLDHFRGFVAYWRVPASAPTAAGGRWVRGPGRRLFDAVSATLGELPLVAEDLGVITPAVERLRRELGLPGMRVVQFAFGEDHGWHLPERCPEDTVIYTGTHDNDTTRGWFEGLEGSERERVLRLAEVGGPIAAGDSLEVVWRLVAAALGSRAEIAIVPVQDVLGLGSEGRMNTPGTAVGNWRWRMPDSSLTESVLARLRSLTERSGRLPPDRRSSR